MSNRLGKGRHLSGRQFPGQNGKRAPRDGLATRPGHQPAAHRRPLEHRRRQPPPRPRPAAHAQAASDRMNDFAGSLAFDLTGQRGPRGDLLDHPRPRQLLELLPERSQPGMIGRMLARPDSPVAADQSRRDRHDFPEHQRLPCADHGSAGHHQRRAVTLSGDPAGRPATPDPPPGSRSAARPQAARPPQQRDRCPRRCPDLR